MNSDMGMANRIHLIIQSIFFLLLYVSLLHSYVDPLVSSEISRSGKAPVIILLKDTTPLSSPVLSEVEKNSLMAAKRNVYAAAQNRLISSRKLTAVKKQYTSFNGFSANLDQSELSSLASDPTVEGIYYDRIFYGADAAAWPLINVTPAYSVQVGGMNSTGAGKTVCILDTGVNYTQPDFGGCANAAAFAAGTCPKFVGGYDFVNSDTDPMDDNNHGTHISGIVNRTAPGARIAMVKVLDASNTGTLSNILSGIDWCNNNRAAYNISVISMSISDSGQYAAGSCPNFGLTASLDSAKSNGIFIAVASGNNHFSAGVSSPACENSVYSVGAVYASNVGSAAWSACTDSSTQADQVACFTNYGNNLDILAPGAIITSTNRNGGTLDMGGTSQATPFVSAAVAIVQSELAAQGQSLTPDQLYQKLNQSGKRITLGSYSIPRLNAYAFLQAADTFPAVANYSSGTPSDGATYYSTAMLNISFSMNKNLQNNSVNFEWNGTNTTLALQNNAASITEQLPSFGRYNYRIWSTDALGNSGATGARSVTRAKYLFGTVSYWPFDSNAYDALGLNNGTAFGTTLNPTGGKVGGAYLFGGISDYVNVSSSPSLNLTSGISIEAWVKTNGTGYIIVNSR